MSHADAYNALHASLQRVRETPSSPPRHGGRRSTRARKKERPSRNCHLSLASPACPDLNTELYYNRQHLDAHLARPRGASCISSSCYAEEKSSDLTRLAAPAYDVRDPFLR